MGNDNLPILTVYQVTPQFDRFVIQNEQGWVWTGYNFAPTGAALFANHNQACIEVHEILKRNFHEMQPVKFVVPCFIEVYSHELVNDVDVAKFLSKASKLILDTGLHGNGPGSSLVLPVLDWKRIEELPNE